MRQLLGHAGFHVRIGRARSARCRQRECARYALRMLECGLCIRIILAPRRIMNSKDVESRLIHQYLDSLGNDSSDCTYCIADRGMRGYGQRRA